MIKVYCVETQMKLVPPSYLVGGVLFHLLYLLCSLSVISSSRPRAGLPLPRASVCESESEEWPEIITSSWDFFGANSVKMRKWMKPSLKNLRKFLNHRPLFSQGIFTSQSSARRQHSGTPAVQEVSGACWDNFFVQVLGGLIRDMHSWICYSLASKN